jgi:hypothetical protein
LDEVEGAEPDEVDATDSPVVEQRAASAPRRRPVNRRPQTRST